MSEEATSVPLAATPQPPPQPQQPHAASQDRPQTQHQVQAEAPQMDIWALLFIAVALAPPALYWSYHPPAGSFDSWILLIVVVVVAVVALGILTTGRRNGPPPVKLTAYVGDLTQHTLRYYCGMDYMKPTLVAVQGTLFDVTTDKRFLPGELASWTGRRGLSGAGSGGMRAAWLRGCGWMRAAAELLAWVRACARQAAAGGVANPPRAGPVVGCARPRPHCMAAGMLRP